MECADYQSIKKLLLSLYLSDSIIFFSVKIYFNISKIKLLEHTFTLLPRVKLREIVGGL